MEQINNIVGKKIKVNGTMPIFVYVYLTSQICCCNDMNDSWPGLSIFFFMPVVCTLPLVSYGSLCHFYLG